MLVENSLIEIGSKCVTGGVIEWPSFGRPYLNSLLFPLGISRVMGPICRCSQMSYPLCNNYSHGSFPAIQLPRHVISCISRCNLVLSFSALEQSPSRCPTNLQGYEGLSSEARNGIQRLRGFLGRWFSQIYDKLSESAEAELSL